MIAGSLGAGGFWIEVADRPTISFASIIHDIHVPELRIRGKSGRKKVIRRLVVGGNTFLVGTGGEKIY